MLPCADRMMLRNMGYARQDESIYRYLPALPLSAVFRRVSSLYKVEVSLGRQ